MYACAHPVPRHHAAASVAAMSERKGLSRPEILDVYQTYGALMRRRCQVVIKNDGLADDVLQTVFVNLIRYGGAFRDANSKLAFLYTACDRACWALLDKRNRRELREQKYRLPKPAPAAERIADRDLVLKVLHTLDSELRQLALLIFVDGLSQGEAGRRLGWSRQTVNKKVQRITRQAKDLLGEVE